MDNEDLVSKLRELEGVTGVVLVAEDGTVLTHDLEGDVDKQSVVAVLMGTMASQVGETLTLGTLSGAVVVVGQTKMLVLEQPDYYVGLVLGERVSPDLIASRARGILK